MEGKENIPPPTTSKPTIMPSYSEEVKATTTCKQGKCDPSSFAEYIHPFAKTKVGPKPYMHMSEQSLLEWRLVTSAADCIKWHLKWTPWFSPQMIEALVKYGYNAPHTE